MELLKTTKISNGLCQFSPDGSMVAYVLYKRLKILRTTNFTHLHLFTCQDNISFIEWSPDSRLILCGVKDIKLVQVIQDNFNNNLLIKNLKKFFMHIKLKINFIFIF